MFDSRTDASVYPGTHTYGHAERHDHREMSTGGTRLVRPYGVRRFQPGFLSDAEAIAEGVQEQVQIVAEIAEEESAWLIDCEAVQVSRRDFEAAHAEALTYNVLAPWERELLLPWTDKDGNRHEGYAADEFDTMWEGEVLPAYSSAYDSQYVEDAYFDAFDEDFMLGPNGYSHDDFWMPFMRIEELRDTFGENWLGNGFHIVQGNAIRRTK